MGPRSQNAFCILIIEDDEVDAELLCQGLDEAGAQFDPEVIHSVEDARRRLAGGLALPDLVILDLGLGADSGLRLLDLVQAGQGPGRLHVIVLTGSEDKADIERAKEAGAATYYVKPRDLEGFLELGREIKAFWIDRLRRRK